MREKAQHMGRIERRRTLDSKGDANPAGLASWIAVGGGISLAGLQLKPGTKGWHLEGSILLHGHH